MSKYFSGLNVEEMPVEFKKEVEEIDNIKNMEERHVKLVKLLTEYREDVGGYRKFDEKKYYRIIQRHGHISVNNPVVDFTTFFWMDLNFNTDVGGGIESPTDGMYKLFTYCKGCDSWFYNGLLTPIEEDKKRYTYCPEAHLVERKG